MDDRDRQRNQDLIDRWYAEEDRRRRAQFERQKAELFDALKGLGIGVVLFILFILSLISWANG